MWQFMYIGILILYRIVIYSHAKKIVFEDYSKFQNIEIYTFCGKNIFAHARTEIYLYLQKKS